MKTADVFPLKDEADAVWQQRAALEADAADPALLEHRRRLTVQGIADADAGRLIDDEAMRAWADSLGTSEERPLPLPD